MLKITQDSITDNTAFIKSAKTGVFENRIAEYLRVFEKRKRRKPLFAGL
jgi:hypothetical protein